MRTTFPPPAARPATPKPGEHKPLRGERRVPHRVPCRVRWYDDDAAEPVTLVGETTDISAGGLGVQIGCPVPPGARVEALVPHLAGEPTIIAGVVAHSRRVLADRYEIGIAAEPR